MQLIGINRFPHIIAINWKYFSKKAQDLSKYLLLAIFYVTKWLLFPFVIQIDLITSSFSKILGWSIIIQLYAKLIILADTAILANTSKKEPLCSCYKHTSWMGWLLKKEGFVCQERLCQHAIIPEWHSWALYCFCFCDVFSTMNWLLSFLEMDFLGNWIPYMQKTCDVAVRLFWPKKKIAEKVRKSRQKCVNRENR